MTKNTYMTQILGSSFVLSEVYLWAVFQPVPSRHLVPGSYSPVRPGQVGNDCHAGRPSLLDTAVL